MEKILIGVLSLTLSVSARAADGYVTKSASGTTSAEVFFAGGLQPLRFTSLDVTSDAAASTLKFFTGTAGATVAKAGTSDDPFAVVGKVAWGSNDLVLIQTAAEAVKWNQVSTNTTVTNKLVTFANPLGTNLAVGDTFKKRLTTAYTPIVAAATGTTNCTLASTASLAADDVLLLDRGPGRPLLSQTVDTLRQGTALITLETPLATALQSGDSVYERLTNYFVVTDFDPGENPEIACADTIDLAPDDYVFIEAASGDRAVAQVASVTTNSVVVLTAALGFTLAADDLVYRLAAASYVATLPTEAGVSTVILSGASGLASNDVVVFRPGSGAASAATLAAAPTATNVYYVTFTETNTVAVATWHNYYKLTNTHTLRLTAAYADYSAVLDTATNLSAADPVIILPATGGVFANQLAVTGADYPLTTLGFTGAVGVALAPGDAIYYVGSTNSRPVGNTTLRLDGLAIMTADQFRPVRVVISGTSACAINALTGVYGR